MLTNTGVFFVCVRVHYIEYLVGLIGKHKLDPISILDLCEVTQELRRRGIALPERPQSCSEYQYKLICAKVCVCQCALLVLPKIFQSLIVNNN